ncbi:MAG: XRE family transcriptional regulator [Marinospirillum sp.]|uniref:helix-turn-helix domain-containing protein n=1 Tax=Marinospirillum sp. TaxID=2183934 RepID=UPI0019E2ED0E|nr:XRE family transcriptional regulator [Marinospirillum sp.]MBE0506900.1 XRE family transcriptional regulator [Marinospirillum sp.]
MFNPSRLSTARKRRQLTKKALAEKAGITQITLTRLETKGENEPKEETVDSLAKALNYPVEFFYQDDLEAAQESTISFRSLTKLTARQKDAAISASEIAQLLDEWISARFNLPEADLLDLRDEQPVEAAAALRRHWGLGNKPIAHMLKLLEAKGVRIFSLDENNLNVDAFSHWRNGVPYIFLNIYKSAERSRFDAAHELGHLVLHQHGEVTGREAEREADQFASAFLVPREDFKAHIPPMPSLQRLITAKKRWGVSAAAMARTAYDSGVTSDWHYRDLCKQISMRGFRKQEPEPMEREQSVLWKKLLEALWSEGITKDKIAKELALPLDEVAALIDGLLINNSERQQVTFPKGI